MRGAILARPTRRAPEAAESQPLEGSGMFIGDPLCEGNNASSTVPGEQRLNHRAPGIGELHSQHERELNRSEGSSMLIGDPLW